MTYSLEVHIATDVPKYIFLPKYDETDPTHKEISNFSIEAHELSKNLLDENETEVQTKISVLQQELDKAVCRMYKISDDELNEIKKSIKMFKEGI